MTAKSRYAKPPQEASQDSPARDPRKCAAWGCPLAGTHTDSLKGSDSWYCTFHNGHDTSEFDRISTRITRHLPLIEHYRKVSRLGPIAGMAVVTGNALQRRQPGETYAQYLRRLGGLVFNAIHGDERPATQGDAA